eukprot:6581210-Ditylum_brightwellii.AAC.1
MKIFFCNFCKDCWFLKKCGKANPGECSEREKARKDSKNCCRKLAEENDMGPYQDGFPHHLPKLSEINEMLIACVYP